MRDRKIKHENTLKEEKVVVRKYCGNFSEFYEFFPAAICFMTYRDI